MAFSYGGIDHVQLAAPTGCEAAARAFYGALLGWRELPKPEALLSRGGVWFRCGSHQVHIGVQERFVPAAKAHPAFSVTGIRDLRAHLVGRGVQVVVDEARAAESIERFYVSDPFGNRIEFMERAQDVHRNDASVEHGPGEGTSLRGTTLVAEASESGHRYEMTDDRKRMNAETVHAFLSGQSYWARGRDFASVRDSMDRSYCVACLRDGDELAGFARVVTDWTTVYYVCDLFVLPDHRSRGIGKEMVRWIVEHPKLRDLAGMLLTDDAHGLYSRFGFREDEEARRRFMRRPRAKG